MGDKDITVNDLKKVAPKRCLCDNSKCAKCLSVNCQDPECLIHTKENKETWWLARGNKK